MTEFVPNATTLSGWRKSSYSSSQNDSCLEVTDEYARGIPVRDSKDAHGPALLFSTPAWCSFVTAVKDREFTV